MRRIRLITDQNNGVPLTSQVFTVPNTGQERLGFHFKYITLNDRWAFDFFIDDQPVMFGRPVVLESNLLSPYGFGVGALVAYDVEGAGDEPGLMPLTDGSIQIFHFSDLEQAQIAFRGIGSF